MDRNQGFVCKNMRASASKISTNPDRKWLVLVNRCVAVLRHKSDTDTTELNGKVCFARN